jgi:uncharacterized membrane protein
MKRFLLSLLIAFGFLLGLSKSVFAQSSFMVGEVVEISEQGQESFMDELVPFQEVKVRVVSGEEKDQVLTLKNSAAGLDLAPVQYQEYKPGDKIKIVEQSFETEAGVESNYMLDGYLKRPGLLMLTAIFVIVVLVVGRIWGLMSLLGLATSFLVIFKMIIPMIIAGQNPVLAAILGSLIIIPTTFYISHGFNIKTHVGVAATLVGLAVTGLLAAYFVDATYLTGFASEEAGFIQVERQGSIDIRGLLLAGIIIGTLGILDDVTVGQSSTVKQLKLANPKMSMKELFVKGMKVGHDHISSMVNTLVLVYSGSALPLLLLFFGSDKSFVDILEFELIAEEIVRMLVGSIGLVLSAPLATIMAAYLFSRKSQGTE